MYLIEEHITPGKRSKKTKKSNWLRNNPTGVALERKRKAANYLESLKKLVAT